MLVLQTNYYQLSLGLLEKTLIYCDLVFNTSAMVSVTPVILVAKQWNALKCLCVASDNRADVVCTSIFGPNVSSWRAFRHRG